MDESGCPVPDWIGFVRAARNSQEQNLEAVSDLPGGQVNIHPLTLLRPTGDSESHFPSCWIPQLTLDSLPPFFFFLYFKIFYRVLREIPAGEELSVWYSNALAQWYDIPTTATPTHDEKGNSDCLIRGRSVGMMGKL